MNDVNDAGTADMEACMDVCTDVHMENADAGSASAEGSMRHACPDMAETKKQGAIPDAISAVIPDAGTPGYAAYLRQCSFVAVDTSSKYLTVLVRKDGRDTLRFTPECAMRHSVILMDELDKVFREAGMEPADADFFAAVTGPGSFTGIRIGISAVKGFSLATGKPMMGISSFDLFADSVLAGAADAGETPAEAAAESAAEAAAENGTADSGTVDAGDAGDNREFVVAIDAGHSHYYVQAYSGGEPAGEGRFVAGEELEGMQGMRYGFEDLPLAVYTKLDPGEALARAVLSGRHSLGGTLTAQYVRKSQAEEQHKCR